MKAKYTKPLLAMELFSLTQSIVRDCNTIYPSSSFTFDDPNTCVLDLGNGTTVFLANTNCMEDGELLDMGCYNNPDGQIFVFRS